MRYQWENMNKKINTLPSETTFPLKYLLNLLIILNNPYTSNTSAPNQIITTKDDYPLNHLRFLTTTVDNNKTLP